MSMDSFWHTITAEKLDAAPAIRVYQGNILGARIKALAGNFPLTRSVLGESTFNAIATHYARSVPSQTDSLNQYGEHFPDFLEAIVPHNPRLKQRAFVSDLASLDWHLVLAYFAKDDDIDLRHHAIDTITEQTRIMPSFSLSIGQFKHPTLSRCTASQQLQVAGQMDSTTFSNTLREDLNSQPIESGEDLASASNSSWLNYALVRQDLMITIYFLNQEDYCLLELIRERTPIFKLPQSGLSDELISSRLSIFKQKGLIVGLMEEHHDAVQ
ncbi:MAG: putative DNA-binding domain-containing protein [Oleiphilus sp.]